MSSVGLATFCSFASFFIIQAPAPPICSLESFMWPMPGRFMPARALVMAPVPVIRTSSRTSGNKPQKVKKIVVCIP